MMSYNDHPVLFHEVYYLDKISIFIVYRLCTVMGFVLINNRNSVVYCMFKHACVAMRAGFTCHVRMYINPFPNDKF